MAGTSDQWRVHPTTWVKTYLEDANLHQISVNDLFSNFYIRFNQKWHTWHMVELRPWRKMFNNLMLDIDWHGPMIILIILK